MDAIEASGHLDKIILGMDVASSEFYVDGKYDLASKSRTPESTEPMLTGSELASFYKDLCKDFPIKVYILYPLYPPIHPYKLQ